ncbi:MAG: filamentous hemagglutinin N-terminal domain-containing protein, partial [Candidatus Omnitrophota bacterium]
MTTLNVIANNGTVINFNSFNIASNEVVNFNPYDPSLAASTNVLSRVTGPDPSYIAGTLNANLNLYLVNTNGINFAPTAQVNVNNLVASTLDISTNNFINGNYVFENNLKYSQILNEGALTADNIALIASSVHNTPTGIIIARVGTVSLTSGDKVTVSFDMKGLMNVEVNEKTTGKVVDMQGNTVKDAVANAGRIEATQVVMTARTVNDIFENAVNQTGIVKATGIVNQNGVIRIVSNNNIQVSGTLEAEDGEVYVSSEDRVEIPAGLNTKGDTQITANGDINVNADITTDSGNLDLIADADLDGNGAFKQAVGTCISTINSGDITIQSSGEGTLASIESSGDLILKAGGSPATFTQWPGSDISTTYSMQIGEGVTINAGNAVYEIGRDWSNLGYFNADTSMVRMISEMEASVSGLNTFNDFSVTAPGKIVKFDPESTFVIAGTLTLKGAYGKLLVLSSTEPSNQWKILPQGDTDIAYVVVKDCINIRGPPLSASHSDSSGNVTNWDINLCWTGQSTDSNWSTADNWDTGTIPQEYSSVLFDNSSNLDSVIDENFQGTIRDLTVDGYTGTITFSRNISVTQNMTLNSGTIRSYGTLNLTSQNDINIGALAYLRAENIFIDSGETANTYISGILDASNEAFGQKGGNITILGNCVGIFDATIDASGDSGGGAILIGGDYRGEGDILNSKRVNITSGSIIYADAIRSGNGGRVIVWSDEVTKFYGKISVKGGAESGDGGFIETSSGDYVELYGAIDASAPNGNSGTWLIDPTNVTISSATANMDDSGGNPRTFSPTASGTPATLNAATLNTALTAGTSCIVDTISGLSEAGNITVSSAIAKTGGADCSLTLNATGGITVNAGISSTSGKLNLTLTSAGAVDINSSIELLGGTFSSTGTTFDNTGGTIDSVIGNVTINHTGIVTIGAAIGGTNAVGVTAITGSSINIGANITANGSNLTLNSPATVTATPVTLQAGTGTITTVSTFACGENAVIFTSNGISLGGTVSGTSTIILRPASNNMSIGIAGAAGTYNLDATEIGYLTSTGTFSTITIGRTGGTGLMTINTVSFNDAIYFYNYGSGGDITIAANQTITTNGNAIRIYAGSGTGTLTQSAGASINAGSGAITLMADNIVLDETTVDSIIGTGSVTLRPLSAATSIGVAGGAGTLNITANELLALKNGFSVIIIGYSGGTELMTINTVSFNDSIYFYNYGVGGNITIAAGQTLTSNNNVVRIYAGSDTGTFTQGAGASINAGSGTIIIQADNIILDETTPNGIIGTSSVTLRPMSVATSVGIAGGAGTFNLTANELLALKDGFSSIAIGLTTGTGLMTINTVSFNDPVYFYNYGDGGDITITAGQTVTSNNNIAYFYAGSGTGTFTQGAGASINAGSEAITIQADNIILDETTPNGIIGTSTITLQPTSVDTAIGIGTGASGTFNLNANELLALKNGFSLITIGLSNGTGAVSVSAITFNDPITIQSPGV